VTVLFAYLLFIFCFRFAQRVSNIRNNALVNAELDPYVMIAKLKQDLFEAREDVARLRVRVVSVVFNVILLLYNFYYYFYYYFSFFSRMGSWKVNNN